MKKLATAALAIALAFSASTAMAQGEPGDLGVFADPVELTTTLDVTPFVNQVLYVVAFDTPGDIKAYEFGLDFGGTAPIKISDQFTGPGPLNFGSGYDYLVGAGGCVSGAGAVQLAAITVLFVAPPAADTSVCIGGVELTSFPPDGAPGWSNCNDELTRFGVALSGEDRYPDSCLILNATQAGPVRNEDASFGELKARF